MDLTQLSDDQLDARRIAVLTEQERRRRLADAPRHLEATVRDALAAGADPETIRAAMTAALEPKD